MGVVMLDLNSIIAQSYVLPHCFSRPITSWYLLWKLSTNSSRAALSEVHTR